MSTAERRVPALLRSASVRASKLEPARLRAGAIQRERLLGQLAAAADTPIVLISASAGYGKSTLAAQWSAQCQRPVAWINVDRSDNDPIAFLRALAHALDRIDPADAEILNEFSGLAPRVEDIVLAGLYVELDRLSPVELILDDTQELTQPKSVDILTYLLKEIGPRVPGGASDTRGERSVVARRRVTGDLLEIRAEDLALDADEVREVADKQRCAPVRAGARASVRADGGMARREALALHTFDGPRPPSRGSLGPSAGDHRDIADYLAEVMLDREPKERRRFLLATSVVTQMTAPLCDAVLGMDNSSEVLAELERTNSFVIALDDHRGWYRYHHLFAELLRSELDRTDPELAAEYLARAAAWHQQEGATRRGLPLRPRKRRSRARRTIALAATDGFVRLGRIET